MPVASALELPLVIFLLAAVPFLESRFAIPYAIGSGMTPWPAILLGIAGNMVLVAVSVLALVALEKLRNRWPLLDRAMDMLDRRAGQRSEVAKKYGWVGLVLLVGIPIPGTGIWTGLAVAKFLGLPLSMATLGVSLGVVLAGLIVGGISTGVFSIIY